MTIHIAIVGGGPKGLYGLERLVAQLATRSDRPAVEIHLFNRTADFGAGEIYATDQPDYLLINYAIGNITMWIDEAPATVAPRPISLTRWLQARGHAVTDHDFASRAQVGRYLRDGLEQILGHLPERVMVRCIVGEVVDLWHGDEGYRLRLRAADGDRVMEPSYQHLLLATGHPRPTPLPADEAEDTVPFIYPVDAWLPDIPAQQPVAIKGMALTFIDAALALTEGRGGRFAPRAEGGVDYHPSGDEPSAIYPFSRSGLPMVPRGPDVASRTDTLCFFTAEALAVHRPPYDFEATLWPLLHLDFTWAYYRVLFQRTAFEARRCLSADEMTTQIEEFHRRYEVPRFSIEQLFDPLAPLMPLDGDGLHRAVASYLHAGIEAAQRGPEAHPLAALSAVWRAALPRFRQCFAFGGLTEASHLHFLREFAPALIRISFGPPLPNAQKIAALVEAGLLRFDVSRGARCERDEKGQLLLVRGAERRPVSRLIDGRIPKLSLTHNASPLARRLVERGLAQMAHDAEQGGLAISRRGALLNAQGSEERITLTGTPTEGALFDNDSLSRHCNNLVSGWAADCLTELLQRNPDG